MIQDQYLNCIYKIASSENLEPYLEKIGVPPAMCSLIVDDDSATFKIEKEGGSYLAHTTNKVKNETMTFTPGEEFEHTAPHGKTFKGSITVEPNKITHVSADNPGASMSIEFRGNQLIVTLKEDDCVATRIFKKV